MIEQEQTVGFSGDHRVIEQGKTIGFSGDHRVTELEQTVGFSGDRRRRRDQIHQRVSFLGDLEVA